MSGRAKHRHLVDVEDSDDADTEQAHIGPKYRRIDPGHASEMLDRESVIKLTETNKEIKRGATILYWIIIIMSIVVNLAAGIGLFIVTAVTSVPRNSFHYNITNSHLTEVAGSLTPTNPVIGTWYLSYILAAGLVASGLGAAVFQLLSWKIYVVQLMCNASIIRWVVYWIKLVPFFCGLILICGISDIGFVLFSIIFIPLTLSVVGYLVERQTAVLHPDYLPKHQEKLANTRFAWMFFELIAILLIVALFSVKFWYMYSSLTLITGWWMLFIWIWMLVGFIGLWIHHAILVGSLKRMPRQFANIYKQMNPIIKPFTFEITREIIVFVLFLGLSMIGTIPAWGGLTI